MKTLLTFSLCILSSSKERERLLFYLKSPPVLGTCSASSTINSPYFLSILLLFFLDECALCSSAVTQTTATWTKSNHVQNHRLYCSRSKLVQTYRKAPSLTSQILLFSLFNYFPLKSQWASLLLSWSYIHSFEGVNFNFQYQSRLQVISVAKTLSLNVNKRCLMKTHWSTKACGVLFVITLQVNWQLNSE